MVVIKSDTKSLSSDFGKGFMERLAKFSEVVGFSIEEENEEIKVEFNPDRPDLFSFVALNKAMKCYYDRNYWVPARRSPSGVKFNVRDSALALRGFAAGFVAVGKPIGSRLEHIMDYQERIHANTGKSRSKVSIGIHDLDKIAPPFEFSAVEAGKVSFTTYDGTVSGTAEHILRTHPKGIEYSALIPQGTKVPLITDSRNRVLSLPPVINGTASLVESKTERFFIDITGTDRKATRDAYYLLMYEFMYMGYSIQTVEMGNEIENRSGIADFDGRNIDLSRDEVKRITGMSVSQESAIDLLRRMGYVSEPSSKWLSVSVPGNRVDVMGPVDVIEDIAKAYGMARIKEKTMGLPLVGVPERKNDFADLAKDTLIGAGMQEVRTFVVSSSAFYKGFSYRGGVEVLNPKSLDFSVIRDRLYVNMLDLLRINKRRSLPHRIFEVGDVYVDGKQEMRLCAMIMDTLASYSSIKQILDYLSMRLGAGMVEVREAEVEGFIPGRSGEVYLGGAKTGIIGEMAPETITGFDLTSPVCAMELSVDILMGLLDKVSS